MAIDTLTARGETERSEDRSVSCGSRDLMVLW